MSTNGVKSAHPTEISAPKNGATAEQLNSTIQLLESVVQNRDLLALLTEDQRTRLMQAAGKVYAPDIGERRRLVKAKVRRHKALKKERDDRVLTETGIRKLRREKVFTT